MFKDKRILYNMSTWGSRPFDGQNLRGRERIHDVFESISPLSGSNNLLGRRGKRC